MNLRMLLSVAAGVLLTVAAAQAQNDPMLTGGTLTVALTGGPSNEYLQAAGSFGETCQSGSFGSNDCKEIQGSFVDINVPISPSTAFFTAYNVDSESIGSIDVAGVTDAADGTFTPNSSDPMDPSCIDGTCSFSTITIDLSASDGAAIAINITSVGGAEFTVGGDISISYTPAPVPEPPSLAMLSTGLAGLAVICRRRRRVA
jgi:hypothetical protein